MASVKLTVLGKDTNCQVFGTRGLFVAGSSVFPTSGYANPTLTIVALSLRLAKHIRETMPRGLRIGGLAVSIVSGIICAYGKQYVLSPAGDLPLAETEDLTARRIYHPLPSFDMRGVTACIAGLSIFP